MPKGWGFDEVYEGGCEMIKYDKDDIKFNMFNEEIHLDKSFFTYEEFDKLIELYKMFKGLLKEKVI